MLTELLKLPIGKLLGLSVLGAFITTIGSLLALVLKEYFLSRSFEAWKTQQAVAQVYKKYRDPILLSAIELYHRLHEVCDTRSPIYLCPILLVEEPKRIEQNSTIDRYFQAYKLRSTIYRLCAFLGWLELYRQEVVFLDSGRSGVNRQLESCITAIRSDLADGQLNMATDWYRWMDGVIFREEQRAIGETMIVRSGGVGMVMGYGQFCELLQKASSEQPNPWFRQAMSLVTGLGRGGKDFRLIRLKRLVVHLVDLIQSLQPTSVSQHMADRREDYMQQDGVGCQG